MVEEVADVALCSLPLPGSYLTERVFELVGLAAVGHPLDEIAASEAPLLAHAHCGDVTLAGVA